METLKGNIDYQLYNADAEINLKKVGNKGNVFGISIEVPQESGSDIFFQYNKGPRVRVTAGGPAREIGGFFGSVPVSYDGIINLTFENSAAPDKQVIVAITHLQC